SSRITHTSRSIDQKEYVCSRYVLLVIHVRLGKINLRIIRVTSSRKDQQGGCQRTGDKAPKSEIHIHIPIQYPTPARFRTSVPLADGSFQGSVWASRFQRAC